MPEYKEYGLGWIREIPDPRDFRFTAMPEQVVALPTWTDLRGSDTAIENQGSMGSCVAHAATGIFEWLQKKTTGSYVEGSRMFVYKEGRDLEGFVGDTGMYLRDAAKVMATMGVPPETMWPYNFSLLNVEPTAVVKAEALKSHADSYWKLDGATTTATLNNIKVALATNGLPVMFGSTVYNSIFGVGSSGMIPIPRSGDAPAGGHAMVAMGYYDDKQALLVKNSWGTGWGMGGYGYFPYWYTLNGLVSDCWVVATESQLVGQKTTTITITATT